MSRNDARETRDLDPFVFSSLKTDSWERDWMIRPWCAVIEQNVQPPKQPRMMVTESLTDLDRPGIFCILIHLGAAFA